MILKYYYSIMVYEPQPPSQEIPQSPSLLPYLASTSLGNDQEERRETFFYAPAGRVIKDKGTEETQRDDQGKRREIMLEAQVGPKNKVKGKMEPER